MSGHTGALRFKTETDVETDQLLHPVLESEGKPVSPNIVHQALGEFLSTEFSYDRLYPLGSLSNLTSPHAIFTIGKELHMDLTPGSPDEKVPEQMFMVVLGIHATETSRVSMNPENSTYDILSQHYYAAEIAAATHPLDDIVDTDRHFGIREELINNLTQLENIQDLEIEISNTKLANAFYNTTSLILTCLPKEQRIQLAHYLNNAETNWFPNGNKSMFHIGHLKMYIGGLAQTTELWRTQTRTDTKSANEIQKMLGDIYKKLCILECPNPAYKDLLNTTPDSIIAMTNSSLQGMFKSVEELPVKSVVTLLDNLLGPLVSLDNIGTERLNNGSYFYDNPNPTLEEHEQFIMCSWIILKEQLNTTPLTLSVKQSLIQFGLGYIKVCNEREISPHSGKHHYSNWPSDLQPLRQTYGRIFQEMMSLGLISPNDLMSYQRLA